VRIASSLLAISLVASFATTASAQAVLRYSWGDDANIVVANQDWTGPTTYSQNLSVTGLSGTIDRIDVTVKGPGLIDAWRPLAFTFSPYGNWGGVDCLDTPSTTVDVVVPGAAVIPGATLSAYGYPGVTTPHTTWDYTVNISPPLVADPATRYGIALVSCNLQHATTGYVPGLCMGADYAFCCRVEAASAHAAGAPPTSWVPIMLGVDDIVYWNNSAGLFSCYSTTPARTRTWGELKSRYR